MTRIARRVLRVPVLTPPHEAIIKSLSESQYKSSPARSILLNGIREDRRPIFSVTCTDRTQSYDLPPDIPNMSIDLAREAIVLHL